MRYHGAVVSLAILVVSATTAHAQAMLRPAPSSRATSEVSLSYPRDSAPPGAQPASIKIEYGQPHLRGRALHTDSLVPYDKPWRTGANGPTTLTTGVDLVIGGRPVPKGTYVLWTLPSRTGWTLIIQNTDPAAMQSAMTYVQAYDVARIDLRQQALPTAVESLSMWLIPSTAPGAARGELRIAWGTVALSTDWSLR